jgi:hypothetical protein
VTDPVDVVRAGYDALSYRYRADDSDEGRYAARIDTIRTHCAPGGAVSDAGCGCGVPVSRSVAAGGFVPEGDFAAVRGESSTCLPA